MRYTVPADVRGHFQRRSSRVGETSGPDLIGTERRPQKRIQHPRAEQEEVVGSRQRRRRHDQRSCPASCDRCCQFLCAAIIVADEFIGCQPVVLAVREIDPCDVANLDDRRPQIQDQLVGVAVGADVVAQHLRSRAERVQA